MNLTTCLRSEISERNRQMGLAKRQKGQVVKPRAILSRLGVETASNSFHLGV